jgi:hypothetical protein
MNHRDDVDVLAASVRRIDNSYDRLERRIEMVLMELRETRAELRASRPSTTAPRPACAPWKRNANKPNHKTFNVLLKLLEEERSTFRRRLIRRSRFGP